MEIVLDAPTTAKTTNSAFISSGFRLDHVEKALTYQHHSISRSAMHTNPFITTGVEMPSGSLS